MASFKLESDCGGVHTCLSCDALSTRTSSRRAAQHAAWCLPITTSHNRHAPVCCCEKPW